jgi:hypothetical protein
MTSCSSGNTGTSTSIVLALFQGCALLRWWQKLLLCTL